MIPEDAIWILELIRNRDARTEAEKDAVNAAIEALKAQLSQERTEKRMETHGVCLDAISLQAAVELVMKYCPDDDGAVQCDGDIRGLLDELENLPPAQPEPKEGEWIPVHPLQGDDPGAYMCSKCKTGMWEIRPSAYHYCPNCGAHMRGEKDG